MVHPLIFDIDHQWMRMDAASMDIRYWAIERQWIDHQWINESTGGFGRQLRGVAP
jgi:hypothetical protein